jgi:structural hemagglutinin/hemolysin toxin protein RtxA
MFKICFYVPATHKEEVKNNLFAAGAGKIGNYSSCAWEVLGEGQFMPLDGSHAFVGEKNKIEKVSEYKIEMICDEQYIQAVITALKNSHPYEEPAYSVWRVETL